MEHTNLFLFENESALETKYPNGNVNDVEPGVAYARPDQEEEDGTVYYNRMVKNYSIVIHSRNKSGATLLEDRTIQTPKVLDGNTVKTNVVAEPVEGYKPRYAVEKVEFTSASTEHTVTYLAATSYTVTVHHVFSGQSIACATTVEVEDVYEEDVVNVKIEPLSIPGYTAEAVYIRVSGDTTYDLEYEESTYEAIDLGLPSGTLWCDRNVGASSPEGFGGYYAWGELEEKDTYSYATYRFFDSSDSSYTKYNSNTDEKNVLDPEDDVACVEMGGDWHMPTESQIDELIDYTTSAITTLNGVSGVTLTSTENGNSIFLPFAGYKLDEDEDEMPEDADFAILFTSNGQDDICRGLMVVLYQGQTFVLLNSITRNPGVSVRGVIGDGPASSDPEQPSM